jgi:hypothetical protein
MYEDEKWQNKEEFEKGRLLRLKPLGLINV